MKKLENILESVKVLKRSDEVPAEVGGIRVDSRNVTDNDVFIAYKGYATDGHVFIGMAIKNGASVIVLDDPAFLKDIDIPFILVEDARKTAAVMAANFYGHPSKKIKVVGVTGTNGKTTIASLLHEIFGGLGYASGLISTIEVKFGDRVIPAKLTTPDAISLQELFADMVAEGLEFVFMEVSSHALDQGRVDQVDFDGAIYTNISHDHLDYHETFAAYITAKKRLFDGLKPEAVALVNIDDRNGMVMIQNCRARTFSYALKKPADYKAKVLANDVSGLQLDINGTEVFLKLIGYFNAYNALAAFAMSHLLGQSRMDVLAVMSSLDSADGRMDVLRSPGGDYLAVVDYAHTPDALKNVLETLVEVKNRKSRLITVVGCGGNRDKSKRPVMGALASKYSDQVVLTSDNPRDEDPTDIIEEMMVGIEKNKQDSVLKIPDRREAIKIACRLALKGDIVLVAGKGHEHYQEIKGQRYPFDDKKILSAVMR